MQVPDKLKFTKDHEWAREEDNSVVVGITAFAVEQLGDITLVELPEVGSQVKRGESFGTIESVKSVSELYAPLSGKVSRVNQALEDKPELVNDSPHEEGWMIAIEPSEGDLSHLLDAAAYEALLNGEEGA